MIVSLKCCSGWQDNDYRLIEDKATWTESYTKLLAFNQTQYDRVLNLDSDSTVLQVRLVTLEYCNHTSNSLSRRWTNSFSSHPFPWLYPEHTG